MFLTAYYIFRAFLLAFHGDHARDPSLPHAHEGPWTMQVPLVVLSALAVVAGLFVFLPAMQHLLAVPSVATSLVGANVPPTYAATDLVLSSASVLLGVAGIAVAFVLWGNGRVYVLAESSPPSRFTASS